MPVIIEIRRQAFKRQRYFLPGSWQVLHDYDFTKRIQQLQLPGGHLNGGVCTVLIELQELSPDSVFTGL